MLCLMRWLGWYSLSKITEDGEVRNGDVSSNVEQELQLINGPQDITRNLIVCNQSLCNWHATSYHL